MIREPMGGWFVWTKRGRSPRKAHPNYETAAAEAKRLAKANPGTKFIVLQMVAKYSVEAPTSQEAPSVQQVSV